MNTRRGILEDVAAGRLDPHEAAVLLSTLAEPAPEPPSAEIRRLRISCELGKITVVGDPSVATASVSGVHQATTEGDTLIIESGPGTDHNGFVFSTHPPRFGWGRPGTEVSVRANPALALELRVAAGSTVVRDMRGPINGRIEVGAVRIDGFAAPLDLQVDAGSLVARGRLDSGASRLRCELGKIQVDLEKGSDVTISARTELGKIVLPGDVRVGGLGSVALEGNKAVRVGAGTATLELRAAAGHIEVRA